MSLKNLRIADLEIFITAARLKSLGKSAIFHHLSQSAASIAIQRVEEIFGIPLCTHEKRQFQLTREGQLLLPKLENWLNELHGFALPHDPPPIRLVATHGLAQVAMPALLSLDRIEFKQMRPDRAYAAVMRGEADIALVLDNAPWKGVAATEIGRGFFQLYSRSKTTPLQPVLLPEDQMEVLTLQQSWEQIHGSTLPIKSRIPSWSLIASICSDSAEVGFLPDFLAKKWALHPVSWQPEAFPYRVLAIYRMEGLEQERRERLLHALSETFIKKIPIEHEGDILLP